MEISEVGEVIAERAYKVRNGEGASEIKVLLGRPAQFPDSTDFFTRYQILGVGTEKVRFAGGVDSFQSLQLALQMVGNELEALNRTFGGKLEWAGDE